MKTLDEAKQFLKDNNIKYVLAQFVDIHGVAKVKSVPVAHFETILSPGAGFAGGAIIGTGILPNGSDYFARGDLSTLSTVPWQKGYARLICDGYYDNEPFENDPRVMLKKQIARLAEKGWTLSTGLEPEFSLLKRTEKGGVVAAEETDNLSHPCYDYKGITRSSEYLERMTDALIEAGLDIYQIDHEDANGQYEINYTYADCLESADNYILFKMGASEIAHEMGMICSFMPKPFSDRPGNGMHMHMSIADSDGKNLFYDESDEDGHGLSELAYHFLGGILHHAKALAAIATPTVNSYKRLIVNKSVTGSTWAPSYISYGNNNRSTMVRIPFGRLELRLPDGSCNPYLTTAAVIAAGLDGVERKLDPGKGSSENLFDKSFEELEDLGIGILPQSLSEALDELEKDTVLCDAIGNSVIEQFLTVKRAEWAEYQRCVTDWEINRYVEFY
ncbi:MAG: type III glutamate--ammonia ligase [Methylophaga sp.]|nr:MAG: type III glutamate--ammonia ligase [Methylophaga sp.]